MILYDVYADWPNDDNIITYNVIYDSSKRVITILSHVVDREK